jgi:hypothetical protein
MRKTLPAPIPPLSRFTRARGASLVDALVALSVIVTVTAGVGHLMLWGRRATWSAGSKSIAVTLAIEQMEKLLSLPWEVDTAGTAISDETTDLSFQPPRSTGAGLQPSPSGSLDANTVGFVDYLDADGRWKGSGAQPANGAAFVRRWSIHPFGPDAANTLVLTVLVFPLADGASSAGNPQRRVRLTTIRTRVVR